MKFKDWRGWPGVAVGLALALLFAALWGGGEYRRGRAESKVEERTRLCADLMEENKALRTILTDRAASEEREDYVIGVVQAILGAFFKVKPRMPEGVPKDPEVRKKAWDYWVKHGKPWPGPGGESLDNPDEVPSEEAVPARGGSDEE
ncbi:MAG TPA: hypothetical protein VMW93_07210 [bacterium]|nr:hypothetical protein [bacterium]